MKTELPNEKEINPEQLLSEIKTSLGYDVDIKIYDTPRTQTVKDEDGQETVEYIGYSFELFGVKDEDMRQVEQVVSEHSPEKKAVELSLEERVSILESKIKELKK